jgi:hypothetical protein
MPCTRSSAESELLLSPLLNMPDHLGRQAHVHTLSGDTAVTLNLKEDTVLNPGQAGW